MGDERSAQAEEWRAIPQRAASVSLNALADRYGVAKATTSEAVNRKTWAHLA
jgi:hypothetical protein